MIVVLPESFSATRFAHEKHARKIMSLILTRQIDQVAEWRSSQYLSGPPSKQKYQLSEWANVSTRELRRIHNDYSDIIIEMVNENILKKNEHYSNYDNNKFCMSYCLHEDLQNDKLCLSTIKQRKRKRTHKKMKGYFNLYHQRAAGWIDCFDLPEELVQEYERICCLSEWPDYQRAQVAKLNGKYWWDTVDKFGRYHTPISNMNKKLRPYLVCNHEHFTDSRIVGFDFANFQPSLLDHFSSNDIAIQIPEQERSLYLDLCRKGKIYQHMANNSFYKTADEAKKALLKMLNVQNEFMRNTTIWKVFDQFFPTYSQLIQAIKQGGTDSHKRMAKFLQEKESQIIFNNVVNSFTNFTDNQIPFFTVHDAVYTVVEAQEKLRKAMEATIQTLKISTRIKQEGGVIHCSTFYPSNVSMKPQQNLRLSL